MLANATAPDTTLSVVSATPVTVTPIGTIYVHNSTSTPTAILSQCSTALSGLFSNSPIGGYAIGAGNVLPLNQIIAALGDADMSIVDVVLSAPSTDVSLGATGIPIPAWCPD